MNTTEIEQPCTIDLGERRDIIKHLRDIINMGNILGLDINKEISEFLRKAQEIGWAKEHLDLMLEAACNYTIYEQYLERRIRERGDYWKYNWKQKLSKAYSDSDSIFKTKGAWAG